MLSGPLKLLFLVLLGFGLMLGLISRKKVGKIIGRMLFFPILILFAYGLLKNMLKQLPPNEQFFYILIFIFILLLIIIMTTQFGREVLASFIGSLLHDIFKWIFNLTGGFFSRILRFIRRR